MALVRSEKRRARRAAADRCAAADRRAAADGYRYRWERSAEEDGGFVKASLVEAGDIVDDEELVGGREEEPFEGCEPHGRGGVPTQHRHQLAHGHHLGSVSVLVWLSRARLCIEHEHLAACRARVEQLRQLHVPRERDDLRALGRAHLRALVRRAPQSAHERHRHRLGQID